MAQNQNRKTGTVTEEECLNVLKDKTGETSLTIEGVRLAIELARQASTEEGEQRPGPTYQEVANLLGQMEKAGDGIAYKVEGGKKHYYLKTELKNTEESSTNEVSPASSVRSLENSIPEKEGEEFTMESQNQGQEAQVQGSGALPSGKKPGWRPSLVGVACIVIGVIVGSAGVYAAMNLRSANAAQAEKKSEEAKTEEVKKAEPETVTKTDLNRLQGQVDELGKRVDGHDVRIVQIGEKTDVLEKAQTEQYSKYESALAEFGAGLRDVNDAFGKDKDGKFQALYNSSGQTWQAVTADLSQGIAEEKRHRMSNEALATLQNPGGYAFVADETASGSGEKLQPQPVPARPVNQVYTASNVNVEEGYVVYWSPQDSAWITIRWNPGVVNSPCTYQMSYYCQNSGCYKWRHCRRMWRKAWKRGC